MNHSFWNITRGDSQLVATALHSGHIVRDELRSLLAVSESDRLREEDPGTELLAGIAKTNIIVKRSRFETDLNRPRGKAVYINPEDAWNLKVWKKKPSDTIIENSLKTYDSFYKMMFTLLTELKNQYHRFLVLDFHAYNHRQGNPASPPADSQGNPEIDIEIDGAARNRWSSLVERLVTELREYNFQNRHLDVRESVRFQAGYFVNWVNNAFPYDGCALAIEIKKFYMEEWSGQINYNMLNDIKKVLQNVIPGVLEELNQYENKR